MKSKSKAKIRIGIESYNSTSLISAQKYLLNTFKKFSKIFNVCVVSLPQKKHVYCVLRSPHVDKDSREHFETRIHKKILDVYYDSELKIIKFLKNIDLKRLSPEVSFRIIVI